MAENKPGVVRPRHNIVDQTRRADPPFTMNNVGNDVRESAGDFAQKMNSANLNMMTNVATNLTSKKKSSFQITSVSTVKHSEIHEGDADSMDDLDETHTEDISSDVLDWSKTTDIEPDPSSTDETLPLGNLVECANAIIKEKSDTTSRFKVVKIAPKEPFRRGRWWCLDFSDDPMTDREKEKGIAEVKPDEFSVPVSENSSAASSVHYVPEQPVEHEDIKGDPNGIFTVKADGGQKLMEDDDYEIQQRQPSTLVKVLPDSGQPSMQDMYQSAGIPNILPNNSMNSVTQNVKDFTNAPPLIPNVPKPQQSHVTQGNNVPTDQMNSVPSNMSGNPQASQSSHVKASQPTTSTQPLQQPGQIGNNVSDVNTGIMSDSNQGTQNMNSGKMVGGTASGVTQGQPPANGNHPNGNVPSSTPEYHQNSQRDSNAGILLNQQTMTTSTVTNSQQTSSTKNTAEYTATNSQNILPRIQVSTQSGYDSKGGAEKSDIANDTNVVKETKDDYLDTIESTEKTQLLLEQMVSSRAGIPAALGSPIKDGEGDERHRRSPLPVHLMEFGSSTVAIDNKIEQAMDLVKSHLMFAVREEVEVLREQIKELLEQKAQLEYENSVLKSAASSETLQKLANGPPVQPPTTSAS